MSLQVAVLHHIQEEPFQKECLKGERVIISTIQIRAVTISDFNSTVIVAKKYYDNDINAITIENLIINLKNNQ